MTKLVGMRSSFLLTRFTPMSHQDLPSDPALKKSHKKFDKKSSKTSHKGYTFLKLNSLPYKSGNIFTQICSTQQSNSNK